MFGKKWHFGSDLLRPVRHVFGHAQSPFAAQIGQLAYWLNRFDSLRVSAIIQIMKGLAGNKVRTITCKGCGETVTRRIRPGQLYCSLPCYRRSERPERQKVRFMACELCGTGFSYPPSRTAARFCSAVCQTQWQGRNREAFSCKTCSATFTWSASRRKVGNPTYCSLACRDADPERRTQLLWMVAKQAGVSPNKLEAAGYAMLDGLAVPYSKQVVMLDRFCVDALVDGRVVVQFDGDYWHGHQERFPEPSKRQRDRMSKDRGIDTVLTREGFRVVRLWESDFMRSPAACAKRIMDAL